jgi:hypothetical protein
MLYGAKWRCLARDTLETHNRIRWEEVEFMNVKPGDIQGVYKRMVRFQKLTRNLFLTSHGHNVHRQQRQLSKFLVH